MMSLLVRVLTFVTAVFLSIQPSIAVEIKYSNPYLLVETVAHSTFERIRVSRVRIDENPDYLNVIMEEELIPHIDYEFASFVVLGKNFKSVPKSKLKKYTAVFRQHLSTTFSSALGYYTDQKIIFEPASDYSGKNTVTVKAIVISQEEPDIKIAFKVRKNVIDNSWKVYDMVAEGISLLNSKRSEFQTILRQDGIDAVIFQMEK